MNFNVVDTSEGILDRNFLQSFKCREYSLISEIWTTIQQEDKVSEERKAGKRTKDKTKRQ